MDIKREKPKHRAEVHQLLDLCFEDEPVAEVVKILRKLDGFEKKMARVAVINEQIIGYVLLSPMQISYTHKIEEALLVSPVAVLPAYQNLGIGSDLLRNVHQKAAELGYNYVLAIGNQDYFERFGYRPISEYGLLSPLGLDEEDDFQLLPLNGAPAIRPQGILRYATCLDSLEFFQY